MSCKHDKKVSCPCLKGLLWIVGIFLITGMLLLVFLGSDHNARWIEWIQLFVNIAGAIAIPIVIWWLSSHRAESLKERTRQIETLNCIYGDLFGISNLMVDLANFTTSILKTANEALVYIDSVRDNFSSYEYNKLYSWDIGKFPISEFSLKYSELNINFISIDDPDLYGYLFQLDKHMEHMQKATECLQENLVNSSVQKANSINSIQLTEEEKKKHTDPKEIDILYKRKSISIEKDFVIGRIMTIKNSLNIIDGIIQNIKKTIPALGKYCEEKYPNQISLHSERRKKFFDRIISYRNESELIYEAIEKLLPVSRNTTIVKNNVKILDEKFFKNPIVKIIYLLAEILDGNLSKAKEVLNKYDWKKNYVVVAPEIIQILEKVMPDINRKIDEVKNEREKQEFKAILALAINSIKYNGN